MTAKQTFDELVRHEWKKGMSPGAVAREVCRLLDTDSPTRKMLEAITSAHNRDGFDRRQILRDFEKVDEQAAKVAQHESFKRQNEWAQKDPREP